MLRDIIDSGKIPVTRLTRIFRQAQSSRIVMSAHAINQGRFPDTSNGKDTDFFFIQQEDPEKVAGEIVSLVKNRLPKAYHRKTADIQVLTPMQRGTVGAANLNMALQQALNPSGVSLNRSGYLFRQGDRVMQLRNNYDKDVFNGDLGFVESVDLEERTLSVNFDSRLVADAGLRHHHPQVARLGIPHRGDARPDDPLCDAATQPDLYGHHPCQEDMRAHRHEEGTLICHPQYDGAETQYEAERTVEPGIGAIRITQTDTPLHLGKSGG